MSVLRIYVQLAPGGTVIHTSEYPPGSDDPLDGWELFTVDVDVPGYVGNVTPALTPIAAAAPLPPGTPEIEKVMVDEDIPF